MMARHASHKLSGFDSSTTTPASKRFTISAIDVPEIVTTGQPALNASRMTALILFAYSPRLYGCSEIPPANAAAYASGGRASGSVVSGEYVTPRRRSKSAVVSGSYLP